jgi:adenylylsulfate kinase
VKGFYKQARQGLIEEFTGISSPYEEPESPDLFLDTANTTLEDSVLKVISIQRLRGILPR